MAIGNDNGNYKWLINLFFVNKFLNQIENQNLLNF